MADVHDKKTRSYNMSRIRSKNTKPEMLVRKFLHANGFRYRLHVNNLPGRPDIVLPKYKTAILVNGCFWHMHKECKFSLIPSSNKNYWQQKLLRNVEKDEKAIQQLKGLKWQTFVLWECQLKNSQVETTLFNLIKQIKRSQNKH